MTTLTINIPENSSEVIADISSLVKSVGGEIIVYSDDDDLSVEEFELVKSSLKEALLIKDGKIRGIPASELWND